jgi:DNA-binding NarL/FixJ family response regulator
MSAPVKITVAEPSAIVRSGLISILKKPGGLHAEVYEVGDMEQLKDNLGWRRPDILIVNPSLTGIFSLRRIRREAACRHMKCVALQYALFDSPQLREYDEVVSIYDTSDQIREKLARLSDQRPDEKRHESLSAREKEVIASVVKGMTNKQIADHLCLSAHTVITHRRNISAKLQIHSTAGLTIYAIVNRLVELDDVKDAVSGAE